MKEVYSHLYTIGVREIGEYNRKGITVVDKFCLVRHQIQRRHDKTESNFAFLSLFLLSLYHCFFSLNFYYYFSSILSPSRLLLENLSFTDAVTRGLSFVFIYDVERFYDLRVVNSCWVCCSAKESWITLVFPLRVFSTRIVSFALVLTSAFYAYTSLGCYS